VVLRILKALLGGRAPHVDQWLAELGVSDSDIVKELKQAPARLTRTLKVAKTVRLQPRQLFRRNPVADRDTVLKSYLVSLAFLTFPHAISARYPTVDNDKEPKGAQDYGRQMVIVERMDEILHYLWIAADLFPSAVKTGAP